MKRLSTRSFSAALAFAAGMLEAATKSAVRSVGSGIGRSIVRGLLGSVFGGGRR